MIRIWIVALLALLSCSSRNGFAEDYLKELQKSAVTAGVSPFGHWGITPKNYMEWGSHSNRLIPVYAFGTKGSGKGIDLQSYSGAPHARFVWIMGGDNLRDFHRWKDWRQIAALVPVVVVSRPGAMPKAGLSRFAQQFAQHRLPPAAAATLARHTPPVWIYLTAPLDPVSNRTPRRAGVANVFRLADLALTADGSCSKDLHKAPNHILHQSPRLNREPSFFGRPWIG